MGKYILISLFIFVQLPGDLSVSSGDTAIGRISPADLASVLATVLTLPEVPTFSKAGELVWLSRLTNLVRNY